MQDIKNYLLHRTGYCDTERYHDDWLTKVLGSEKEECIVVISEDSFMDPRNPQIKDVKDKFNIAAVFDLGAPYLKPPTDMFLLYLTVKDVSAVKFAVFKGDTYEIRYHRSRVQYMYTMPEDYTVEFKRYISKLRKWIETDEMPNNDHLSSCEFMSVRVDEIDSGNMSPKYYTNEAVKTKHFFEAESGNFDLLSDIADILIPHHLADCEKTAKVLTSRYCKYPLDTASIPSDSKPTSVVLQTGDILFQHDISLKSFLYVNENDETIYASILSFVIRPKAGISPEYLYFYLNSSIAENLFSIMSYGSKYKTLTKKNLMNLKVLRRHRNNRTYVKEFNIISHPDVKNYSDYEDLNLENIEESVSNEKCFEDVLNNEIAETIRVFTGNQLRTFLEKDFRELNICFDNEAYKAAVIMAGSILEAILIDWVSEIDKTNHFEEDDDADSLYNCINKIKQEKNPKWNKQAREAHDIRKTRNRIHVKKSLEYSEDVTEELCRKTVDELKDIMDSRCKLTTPVLLNNRK